MKLKWKRDPTLGITQWTATAKPFRFEVYYAAWEREWHLAIVPEFWRPAAAHCKMAGTTRTPKREVVAWAEQRIVEDLDSRAKAMRALRDQIEGG